MKRLLLLLLVILLLAVFTACGNSKRDAGDADKDASETATEMSDATASDDEGEMPILNASTEAEADSSANAGDLSDGGSFDSGSDSDSGSGNADSGSDSDIISPTAQTGTAIGSDSTSEPTLPEELSTYAYDYGDNELPFVPV